jgi:hypothetical protein
MLHSGKPEPIKRKRRRSVFVHFLCIFFCGEKLQTPTTVGGENAEIDEKRTAECPVEALAAFELGGSESAE